MQARWFALMTLVAMAAGLVGCNTVPQVEYDALQAKCNELNDQNGELTGQLEFSQGRVSQLLAELGETESRANRAESRATHLQNQMAARPQPKPTAVTPMPGRRVETSRVSLGSDTLFAPGKATLKSSGRAAVAKLASTIKRDHGGATVMVVGHTDSDKITKSKWKDNLELSAQRAMAVTRELIAAGVSAKSIETVAVGEHHPVASNSSSANKARNRRVVVKILR